MKAKPSRQQAINKLATHLLRVPVPSSSFIPFGLLLSVPPPHPPRPPLLPPLLPFHSVSFISLLIYHFTSLYTTHGATTSGFSRGGVTVTLVSSSSSATSGVQNSSSRSGSSSVPIGAIAGGAAGGVALAVILVLIWQYWGCMIKRTERRRRKEVQDLLTVRENTRRNATSGFRPQSQYRPMFTFSPDNRRVTFLARSPTPPHAQPNDTSPEMASPTTPDDETNNIRETEQAPASPPGLDETQDPSTSSSAAAPLLVGHEPEWRGESDNWQQAPEQEKQSKLAAPRRPPSPTPTPTRARARMQARDSVPAPVTRAPPPPPTPRSPQRPLVFLHTDVYAHATIQQRCWPTRVVRDAYAGQEHAASAHLHRRVVAAPAVLTAVAIRALVAQVATAQFGVPSSGDQPVISPLRNSVLPSSDDRPVIMPRAKNAPAPAELLTTSPLSLRPSVPSLASSVSQYSTASGEPPMRRGFLDSMGRRHRSVVGTIASSTRRTSTLSSASVYSNND
ncbi:hypothetical protein BJV78DRAFT_1280636 [Lactifluus subvellereus]|nr:hypothetical protein BJV78DRAFT_1280636 [Lactifluus subvellereus]